MPSDPKDALNPMGFAALDGWEQDNHSAAFRAFHNSACHMVKRAYKARPLGGDPHALLDVARTAAAMEAQQSSAAARTFFEAHFVPHAIDGHRPGLLTGFFEPELAASLTQTARFRFPLYARPADLVGVDDSNRPSSWNTDIRYGRDTGSGLELYADRGAIQSGLLENQGLELCWLDSLSRQFFIHVQGSARLRLVENDRETGAVMRVTFAAKSGHPYTSLGKLLCERTGIAPQDMPADRLLAWMDEDEDRALELLSHNRSYIFFKRVDGQSLEDGPVAAAKVPLVTGRSMAVDRALHTFGLPFFINTQAPLPMESEPLARLMVAHDTGSAIVGPARGDYFCGTGEEAGLKAGRIRHQTRFTVLLPKSGQNW